MTYLRINSEIAKGRNEFENVSEMTCKKKPQLWNILYTGLERF